MAIQRKRRDRIPSKPNNQRITLRQAIDYTTRHHKAAPASEHGGFFWREGISAVLAQPKCTGIRFYHGLDPDGKYRLVICCVDGDGNDITGYQAPAVALTGAKVAASAKSGDGAVLLDTHWPCPPFCPPDSPLA